MVIANAPPKFETDANGHPVGLWIKLTVGGVTRLGVGSCPSGQNDAEKVLIGDALRNAAMRFGVAVDLWAKGDRADPSAENATASAGHRPARKRHAAERERAAPAATRRARPAAGRRARPAECSCGPDTRTRRRSPTRPSQIRALSDLEGDPQAGARGRKLAAFVRNPSARAGSRQARHLHGLAAEAARRRRRRAGGTGRRRRGRGWTSATGDPRQEGHRRRPGDGDRRRSSGRPRRHCGRRGSGG